jgi:hypothetical protein
LTPVIDALKEWLLSLVRVAGMPAFPPVIDKLDWYPHSAVMSYAQTLHHAWASRESLEAFVIVMTGMPNALAECFGFKSVAYVHDHFDGAMFEISCPEQFPASETVVLSDYVRDAAEERLFFFAAKSGEEFDQGFGLEDVAYLTTENIIAGTERELFVEQPALKLTYEMCRGCPGYCALYRRLCSLVAIAHRRKPPKIHAQLKSVVDIGRKALITREFLRLCLLIEGAGPGTLNLTALNQLSLWAGFDVHVR